MNANESLRPRTVYVCHEEALLNRQGVARWMADWSDLAGIIVLREKGGRRKRRIQRERQRVGSLRMLDILAFKIFYRLRFAARDAAWQERELERLQDLYPPVPDSVPVHVCASINSKGAEEFIRDKAPDLLIARCKQLMRPRIFSLARYGTYVFHPGVCPQYRNAHGCFWALAHHDHENVGMTLLRIDEGIDTGPIFGFYSYDFDARNESHIVIQHRVFLENLTPIAEKLKAIVAGTARPVEVTATESAVWGQPWLSAYLGYRYGRK